MAKRTAADLRKRTKRNNNKLFGITDADLQDENKKSEVVKELSNVVAMIPIGEIEANKHQPRKDFDDEALKDLANSIIELGIIQPLTLRRNPDGTDFKYKIISGERRFRASKLAKQKEVPAYIRVANDQDMLAMALVENIQREDLNALEIALTYGRLKKEFTLSDGELAKRVGKKRSTITGYLGLLRLPEKIQVALAQRVISAGHGKALVGLQDDSAIQNSLFEKTVNENLSVRALEVLVKELKKEAEAPPKQEEKASLSTEYFEVQDRLRTLLEVNVKIKVDEQGKGQISIPFGDTNAFNRILDVIDL